MQIVRAVSKPSTEACLDSHARSQEKKAAQKLSCSLLAAMILASTIQLQVSAQGSPIPGGSSSNYARNAQPSESSFGSSNPSAPLPGGNPASYAAPVTQQVHATNGLPGKSIYNSLPLNAEEAKIRLEDLSNRLAVTRPDDLKDAIYALSEWLQDVADAHWKMYKTFEKIDGMKAQAAKEKDIGLKFSGLKNRAKLLKADLFIKQNRYPEALGPLVEIVTSEPTTTTGQDAYKRLVDMGFSEQASGVELAEKGAAKR